jgi:hypothetical protein
MMQSTTRAVGAKSPKASLDSRFSRLVLALDKGMLVCPLLWFKVPPFFMFGGSLIL